VSAAEIPAGSVWTVAVAAGAELGERPVWDDAADGLVWVDILAGRLLRHRPGAGDASLARVDGTLGAAGLRAGGGYILAAGDRFRLVDVRGREDAAPIAVPGVPEGARFNDGACDPVGRFWAGTVAAASDGALYRLGTDGDVETVLEGVGESNGIGWSPDARTCYFVDSAESVRRIRAFEFDPEAGTLGASTDLATFHAAEGVPDGLTVDAEGGVWVAMWGGGTVRRFAPVGRTLEVLPLPVSQPTCPGFGGSALDQLFVTSAWEGMDDASRAAEPLAGHVFVTSPGVRGLPAARYAG
jgi:sugar lactone lactonase YvrE